MLVVAFGFRDLGFQNLEFGVDAQSSVCGRVLLGSLQSEVKFDVDS